jgi:hypothetical protein
MSCFPPNSFPKHLFKRRTSATANYDRQSRLPKLIGLWPSELEDFSAEGTQKILTLLRKALRSERARGKAGHWTYDLNRHLALAESLRAEEAALRALARITRLPASGALRTAGARSGNEWRRDGEAGIRFTVRSRDEGRTLEEGHNGELLPSKVIPLQGKAADQGKPSAAHEKPVN